MLRDRRDNDDDELDQGWMTTFSDMMMLLLTFFVLLYSMSVIDAEKFEAAISSFQDNLGVLEGGRTISSEEMVDRGSVDENIAQTRPDNLRSAMEEMNQYVEEEGLSEQVNMELTEKGLVVRFTGQILYDIGEATIKPDGQDVLDEVADILKELPNNVMVEGHTDDWPIDTEEFPSNWELSTARATNVIKYFIEENELDPARLSAAGYSEYHPLESNDTPENRAQNRRVEVVILNTLHEEEQRGSDQSG